MNKQFSAKRNQYADPKRFVPATDKQKRQRELSWALRICLGFQGSLHFLPKGTPGLTLLRIDLSHVINVLRQELRNIK